MKKPVAPTKVEREEAPGTRAAEIERVFELGRELYRAIKQAGPRLFRDERSDLLVVMNSIAAKSVERKGSAA